MRGVFDWLDSRTGFRTARHHLLDEPIPSGVGWWFITGSILLFLLGVQVVTGIVLTMYYVPSPENAYDSVRFIMDGLPFGALLRGFHFFGASFIVVAALLHLVRVVMFGSYKKPRELTWITGVLLLLVILAFALSGYLLPWDQKAYWATTVTINIARGTPVLGEHVANLMRGGADLGALTLVRWYSAHVFLLPAALIVLVLSHLYLMRRHGISGPIEPVAGPAKPFFPYHVLKDTIGMAVVFAVLLTFVFSIRVPLDAIADPSDASYIPRPEWYFLSLFQLLKYFPGPLEPVATMVIPGVVVGGLLMLPFLDSSPHRHPFRRPVVMLCFGVLGLAVTTLTTLGLRDTPPEAASEWTPMAIAGQALAADERCQACHRPGGAANPVSELRLRRDPEWIAGHLADPEVIAPGLRPAPPGGLQPAQAAAVVQYLTLARAGAQPPEVSVEERMAATAFARHCVNCHQIDGEGGAFGPDLSHIGQTRDAAWLRAWIADPSEVDVLANMPGFVDAMSDTELGVLSDYLAARK
ncbi:MAG: cytochrome b N-terminal domain-containing protein [Vicinamibacterales bacterium]